MLATRGARKIAAVETLLATRGSRKIAAVETLLATRGSRKIAAVETLLATSHNSQMSFFKEKYRVESTRKLDWDYRLPGWYFVTICTQRRICHFGSVVGGKVRLSRIGEFAENHWKTLPSQYANIALDSFVVMPNHLHGIIVIEGKHAFSPADGSGQSEEKIKGAFSTISPRAGSVAAIIRSYKAGVTLSCRRNGLADFQWQPRFHDHIIRGQSLNAIRDYVQNNPANWDKDELNETRLQGDVASYVSTE